MLNEYKDTQVNQTERLNEPNIRSDLLVTDRIVGLVGNLEGKEVLELGSGNGKVARKLHALGAHVTGVDVVAEQVDIAKGNSPSDITYIEADFSAQDFLTLVPAGPYDLVVSVMSIFYLSSTQISQALRNVKKLIKPDGILIIGTASPYRGLKKENFDYFKEQEVTATLPSRTSEPFVTQYIHLPLEFLMTTCVQNGFTLTKFIEPHATSHELVQNQDILTERDLLTPDYLVLEFKSAAS